jgi:glutathione S-transferase
LVPLPYLFSSTSLTTSQSSQSQRILWLLEELQIDYNLIPHTRNPANHPTGPFQSPDSLKEAGPYGHAPLLITGAADGHRSIPESSAIATYLLRTFDTSDRFGSKNGDWIRDEVICSMISTNASNRFALFLDFGIIQTAPGPMAALVTGPRAFAAFTDLERELKEGPKGGYFMGEQPGRCDFLLEWQVAMATQRGWVELKKDYPGLSGWWERVQSRDAYKKALEKGNGYDLNIFPKIEGRK